MAEVATEHCRWLFPWQSVPCLFRHRSDEIAMVSWRAPDATRGPGSSERQCRPTDMQHTVICNFPQRWFIVSSFLLWLVLYTRSCSRLSWACSSAALRAGLRLVPCGVPHPSVPIDLAAASADASHRRSRMMRATMTLPLLTSSAPQPDSRRQSGGS